LLGLTSMWFVSGCDAVGDDDTITVRMSYAYIDELHPARLNRKIAERIEEESDGKVQFEIYPAAQLYEPDAAVEAVQRGDIEITPVVNAYLLALSDEPAVFELPFAFPEREVLYHVLDETDVPDKAFGPLEDYGIRVIASMDYSYIDITNADYPITTLEDMEGIRMRAYGPVLGDFIEAAGGSPEFIAGIEAPTALQQGVIDGAMTGPDSFLHQGYWEFQDYMTRSRHLHCLINYTVNIDWWEGLPDDIRDLMEEIIVEETREWREEVIKDEQRCIDELEEKGMEIHHLEEEERERWIEVGEDVWDEHRDMIGEDIMQELEEAREEFGY